MINPTADFDLNASYSVKMASGVITDKAGNAYAGIADNTTLNFSTLPNVINLGVTDLGANAKLILGKQADNGNWYYFLDQDGSGAVNAADSLVHSTLDNTFNLAKDFVTANPAGAGADTTTDYRFANLNGIYVALPTMGVGVVAIKDYNGTSVSGLGYNHIYDDLLAVWDANNGTGTGTLLNGVPSGWASGGYWAADKSAAANTHYRLRLSDGNSNDFGDGTTGIYAALQVFSGKPPIVSNIAITGADGVYHSNSLNAGDNVYVTVTMSEVVLVDTAGGTPQLGLTFSSGIPPIGYANYVSGSGTNELVFSYTIQAGQTDVNGISIDANSFNLNGGSIRDYSGNNAILTHDAVADNDRFIVDTAAPTLSSATPSNTGAVALDANIMLTFNENVLAGSGDIIITDGTDTRTISVTDTSQVTVSGNTVTINPTANLLNHYSIYHVEMASGVIVDTAGNAYAGISSATTVDFRTNTASINLGAGNGQLINGVQVDGGNWYYHWDANGNGIADAGDTKTHNQLDAIFNFDVNGVANPAGPSADTTETYRYATLNGVHVALPTLGKAVPGAGVNSGTAVGTASPDLWQGSNATNLTYNDLLAVWDAHNGTATTTLINGIPSGWPNTGGFWSASLSGSGAHYSLSLDGQSINNLDTVTQYVALQVL